MVLSQSTYGVIIFFHLDSLFFLHKTTAFDFSRYSHFIKLYIYKVTSFNFEIGVLNYQYAFRHSFLLLLQYYITDIFLKQLHPFLNTNSNIFVLVLLCTFACICRGLYCMHAYMYVCKFISCNCMCIYMHMYWGELCVGF